jgi:hypothetical protein
MSKVRKGVVIKVSKDVHTELVKIVGMYASRYGRRITYSDVIKALLNSIPDPARIIEEYIRKWR